eukprot:CAMPEP_0118929092 /NCGR_PEP_ID=MMETSP1169-20130426/6189_1 /TAXON_ID=36882 /ORGANISM="Pyramimonas obovata, Strain CCMP722" /LENGTH=227 /DNA_ID=CAMNT_0006871217 /DNA_START=172 /DNA_END=855 /DNA_ORIENTATION=-
MSSSVFLRNRRAARALYRGVHHGRLAEAAFFASSNTFEGGGVVSEVLGDVGVRACAIGREHPHSSKLEPIALKVAFGPTLCGGLPSSQNFLGDKAQQVPLASSQFLKDGLLLVHKQFTLPVPSRVELSQAEHLMPQRNHRYSHRVKLRLDFRQHNRIVAAQHSSKPPQEMQHYGLVRGNFAADGHLVAKGARHGNIGQFRKAGHAAGEGQGSILTSAGTDACAVNPQ